MNNSSNLILIGFMGTGKSTVARRLSALLQRPFVDLDDSIEARAGMSVREIFERHGEKSFRDLEAQCLQEVCSRQGQVISTGGGVVLREENMRTMKERGLLIALKASVEAILQRTANHESRPLLMGAPREERIRQLLEQRNPLYEEADISLDTTGLSIEEVVKQLLTQIEDASRGRTRLFVNLKERSYPIIIGTDHLERLSEAMSPFKRGEKAMVVADESLLNLYGSRVEESLRKGGYEPFWHEVPQGEEAKCMDVALSLYESLIEGGFDRTSTLVALGGGVVGDLTGFVAATYMRGIDFIQVPTSLMAQVDSSIGGKVAIDLPQGKNLVGAFYQPRLVFIDLGVLPTLPLEQLQSGISEVIKYAVIGDEPLFHLLEEKVEALLSLEPQVTHWVVKRCCQHKARVVMEDEKEAGLRAILNYGHTIGHALETFFNYQKLLHGQAIAIGMMGAARLALELGLCEEELLLRQKQLLKRAGLPTAIPGVDPALLLTIMKRDKKVTSGHMRFVLPEKIGKVCVHAGVKEDVLLTILSELQREH